MKKERFFVTIIFILCTILTSCVNHNNYDIVVYGGTSAGVIAAVQAARMGRVSC